MTDERVDLTMLIRSVGDGEDGWYNDAERDEIVLALRVLRVLRHPDTEAVTKPANAPAQDPDDYTVEFETIHGPVGTQYESLAYAERLLGLATGKDGE